MSNSVKFSMLFKYTLNTAVCWNLIILFLVWLFIVINDINLTKTDIGILYLLTLLSIN